MECIPMNEKILQYAILITMVSILSNGVLLMMTNNPSNAWITGLTNQQLGHNSMSDYSTTSPTGFISNTSLSQESASFDPFLIVNSLGESIFAGVNAVNFIVFGLFFIEILFVNFASWVPVFAPIFLSFAGLLLLTKLLVLGYAANLLFKMIRGR
jgi:hypothetical protein